MVGNIREWKGQETVVRALIHVVKVRPDLVFFFVGAATPGDRAYKDKLDQLIREAGIEGNVRFTGYQQQVPNFVKMMDFVIHASIQPEPFGMVVLEAMAQHKPVIGSRAGGVIEMVVEGETGYTFPPGDSNMLAARMLELLKDPALCRRMGERGYRRLTSTFTMSTYMNQIHAYYAAILDNAPVPADIGWQPLPRRAQ
jgi:glycosyltransferase involved in cell wall biosynthesis